MTIFLPLSRQQAATIRSDGSTDAELDGFAATGEMISAHGYPPSEREDADYAAMLYASIAGLRHADDFARLVVAAEVPITRIRDGRSDADFGAVRVGGLEWSETTAVFVDEADSAQEVQAAREAISRLTDQAEPGLAAILELPEVLTLSDDHDLLWHIPDEDW